MSNHELSKQLSNALRKAASGAIDAIPELLLTLELDLDQVEDDLRLNGKTVELANREQPELYFKYNKVSQRLKVIVKTIYQKIDDKKAVKYKQVKTSSNISLSTTDINKWVEGDTEVQAMYGIVMLVEDYAYQYDAIVKSFEMRGYALKNITESRINMIHEMTIT